MTSPRLCRYLRTLGRLLYRVLGASVNRVRKVGVGEEDVRFNHSFLLLLSPDSI